MKLLLSLFLLFTPFVLTSLCAKEIKDDPLSVTKKHLKSWQPIKVVILKKDKKKIIRVVLSEKRITKTIYDSVLLTGMCGSLWLNKKYHWPKKVNEIQILNKYGVQGYVFEGGEKECRELGKKTGSDSDFYVLGKTHLK